MLLAGFTGAKIVFFSQTAMFFADFFANHNTPLYNFLIEKRSTIELIGSRNNTPKFLGEIIEINQRNVPLIRQYCFEQFQPLVGTPREQF